MFAFRPNAGYRVLPDDEVHVWCAWLALPDSALEALAQTLSPDERSRAARLRFEDDRRQFIASHSLLRSLIGSYLNRPPESLCFGVEPDGKPICIQPDSTRPLCFNMSHTQQVAMYAFTWGRAVGIDVELIRPISSVVAIVDHFFSPTERSAWHALPKSQQMAAFFAAWTRKEAYLKAVGVGLIQPLDCFTVAFAPNEPARLLEIAGSELAAAHWSLVDLAAPVGYAAALCVEGQRWKLVFHGA